MGPETEEGKQRSAMCGHKGGLREQLRQLTRLLREQQELLDRIG